MPRHITETSFQQGHKPWNLKQLNENKIIDNYVKGKTIEQIAKDFNVCEDVIWRRLKNNNISTEEKRKETQFKKQDLRITGKNHWNWKDGTGYLPYGFDFCFHIRPAIKERDNYTCQNCNIQKQLIVHHIDNNKFNNNPENLITLCISCHIKIHKGIGG